MIKINPNFTEITQKPPLPHGPTNLEEDSDKVKLGLLQVKLQSAGGQRQMQKYCFFTEIKQVIKL